MPPDAAPTAGTWRIPILRPGTPCLEEPALALSIAQLRSVPVGYVCCLTYWLQKTAMILGVHFFNSICAQLIAGGAPILFGE